ncbi:hypothetical protein [Ruminococcus intestinalis]|uniref:hypothetical protein n=1 Tax=Ruminococcus intestinalis TaxID=2763066 RepID=UPI003F7D7D87
MAKTANNTDTEKKIYRVKKNLDPNMIVTIKNGFQGRLVYQSKKTGETFIWEEFGDEQDMELSEAKAARNSSKKFFINNWFLIDDPEVIEYLGVEQYYKHALNSENFDEIFNKTAKEIKEIISQLSTGQKRSLAYRAKQLIEDGTVDSIKVIKALEDGLGVELILR